MVKKITSVEIDGAKHFVIDGNRDGKFELEKGDKLYEDTTQDGRHTQYKDIAMDPNATGIDEEVEGPLAKLIDGAQITGLQDFFSSVDDIKENPLKTGEDDTRLPSQLKKFSDASRAAGISFEKVKKNYGAELANVIDKALDSYEHISAMDAGKSSMLSFQQYIENLKGAATEFELPVDWPNFELSSFNYVNFAVEGTSPEEAAVRSAVKSQENAIYKKIHSAFYDLDSTTRNAIESGVGKIGVSFDVDTNGQMSNLRLDTNMDFPETFLARVKDIFGAVKLPPLEKPVTVNYPVVFGATSQYLWHMDQKVSSSSSLRYPLQKLHENLTDGQGVKIVLILRIDEEGKVLQAIANSKNGRMSEATLPIETAAARLRFAPVPSHLLQNEDYLQVNCTITVYPSSADITAEIGALNITPNFAMR